METRRSGLVVATIYGCFLLSGAAGLVYEVVWTRMLGLVFGHTVFAITTVLAAFMAGLALGAYLFGRLIDVQGRPLMIYGLLEGGIGLSCLLIPFLFAKAQHVYLFLYKTLDLSFFAFSLAQFLVIFCILLVPTTLMGATFPVISKFFVERLEGVGRKVGDLYALNTFGAVFGTGAAGFFLLPSLGVKATTLLAVAANLAIAILILFTDRALPTLRAIEGPRPGTPSPSPPPYGGEEGGRPLLFLLLSGIGLSGTASMIYEVAWTRALSLVIGSSTYAFTAMLTTFLIGLSLGSFLYARIWGRRQIGPALFGFLEVSIGYSALALLPAFEGMPELFLQIFQLSPPSSTIALFSQFLISFFAMILPTTLIGAAFPCVVQLCATGLFSLGRDVGRVYSVNTLGTILGALLAGFFLIPSIGAQSTLMAASLLNIIVGAAVLALPAEARRWQRGLAVSFLLLGLSVFLIPRWNRSVLVSGVSIYAPRLLQTGGPGRLKAEAEAKQLLYYKEGINSTVSVERSAKMVSLKVGGKVDASNGVDMLTQLMLGHLPMLLHPQPERVLVIGLGSGVTVGAVAQHPVKEIDVVELEPAVVEASQFFVHENRNALQDPRVRVAIADGRNFILATEKPYDVITSEPSNPWMAGVANLFSREFYELCRKKLAEGGVMVQWIHGYSLFPQDLKMVVKTFRRVFPHTTVWWTIKGDYLLVGTPERLIVDNDLLKRRYDSSPALRQDFGILGGSSPLALLTLFLLDEEDAARYAEGAPENTDDQPLLEFSAPLALYADTLEENHRTLKQARRKEFPPFANLDEGLLQEAAHRLHFARAFWARGEPEEALEALKNMASLDRLDLGSRLERARLLFAVGRVEEAAQDLGVLKRLRPHDPLIAGYLRAAKVLAKGGRAGAILEHAKGTRPGWDPAGAHNTLGLFYNDLGIRVKEEALFDLALEEFRAALRLEPEAYWVISNLGNAYFEKGLYDQAASTYRRALKLRPDFAQGRFNLGLTYERLGQKPLAIQEYQQALKLQPGWDLPRMNLNRLLHPHPSP